MHWTKEGGWVLLLWGVGVCLIAMTVDADCSLAKRGVCMHWRVGCGGGVMCVMTCHNVVKVCCLHEWILILCQ